MFDIALSGRRVQTRPIAAGSAGIARRINEREIACAERRAHRSALMSEHDWPKRKTPP